MPDQSNIASYTPDTWFAKVYHKSNLPSDRNNFYNLYHKNNKWQKSVSQCLCHYLSLSKYTINKRALFSQSHLAGYGRILATFLVYLMQENGYFPCNSLACSKINKVFFANTCYSKQWKKFQETCKSSVSLWSTIVMWSEQNDKNIMPHPSMCL